MPRMSSSNSEAVNCKADRGHRPRWCTALLAVALVAVIPSLAAGQPPRLDIGHSIFVVNVVDGQVGDTPPALLRIGDDIVFQEDISTGADAKTVIEFRDGSTFEVGPDAVIRIDAFVFNPEESASHKTLSVIRGVFRYISGFVASDQDTKIEVPAGTIGIRGSIAAGIVDPAVPMFLHVAQGNATFTNDAGSSEIGAGQSIAAPSRTTRPMRPDMMPAAVAAQALTSPGHEGAVYTLTGPEALRFKDVAERISAVFARQVDYTDQPPDRARQFMLAGGVSPWQADGNLELFDWIRQGGADTVTAAVREVTGADPSPVQDWLEDSRADFEVPPLDLPRAVF